MKRFEIDGRIFYRERRTMWSVIWFFASLFPFRIAYTAHESGLHNAAFVWGGFGIVLFGLAGFCLYRCTVILDPKRKSLHVIIVRFFTRRVNRLAYDEVECVDLHDKEFTRATTVSAGRMGSVYDFQTDHTYAIHIKTKEGKHVTIQTDGGSESHKIAEHLANDLNVRLHETIERGMSQRED